MIGREPILVLEETESTNNILMDLAKVDHSLPQLYSVLTFNQTAGRGQRGNRWFVSPRKNLTYSFFLRLAKIQANQQYVISEYVVGVVLRAVASLLSSEQQRHLSVKWPNDIYYGDYKLAGILIEHSLSGMYVDYSVVGIGLNVNEDSFPKELPNPISLSQITNVEYDILELHQQIMVIAEQRLKSLLQGKYSLIHKDYMSHLYRREGLHHYRDARGDFWASILDVQPSGHLVLRTEEGEERVYSFKEVVFDADESRN